MDERLRDLDRAAASGDLQARARLLRERVRAGGLDEQRLRLAALLGDEAAGAATGLTPAPGNDGPWLCAVAEVDARVALWALAEGAMDEQPPWQRQTLARLRQDIREAVAAGTAASFARCRPAGVVVMTGLAAKVLLLGLDRLGRDPHRVPPDDPDVLRALGRVRGGFTFLDPGSWTYDVSIRQRDGGWAHVLRYTRQRGGESEHEEPAAAGWEPGPGAEPVAQEVLAGKSFSFRDSTRARAAIREAIVPWLLGGS